MMCIYVMYLIENLHLRWWSFNTEQAEDFYYVDCGVHLSERSQIVDFKTVY